MAFRRGSGAKVVSDATEAAHSEQALKAFHTAGVKFIKTELALADTFCNIASTTTNGNTRERCLANVERAYKSCLYFLDELRVTDPEVRTIRLKLKQLNDRLLQLRGKNVRMFPSRKSG